MSRQLGFFFHLVIVLKVILASQVCLDTYDLFNRSFVLGDTACQERNHASTIFLAICWLLLHVTLFLDIWFPSIVTKKVRLAAPRKISNMPLFLFPLADSSAGYMPRSVPAFLITVHRCVRLTRSSSKSTPWISPRRQSCAQ